MKESLCNLASFLHHPFKWCGKCNWDFPGHSGISINFLKCRCSHRMTVSQEKSTQPGGIVFIPTIRFLSTHFFNLKGIVSFNLIMNYIPSYSKLLVEWVWYLSPGNYAEHEGYQSSSFQQCCDGLSMSLFQWRMFHSLGTAMMVNCLNDLSCCAYRAFY